MLPQVFATAITLLVVFRWIDELGSSVLERLGSIKLHKTELFALPPVATCCEDLTFGVLFCSKSWQRQHGMVSSRWSYRSFILRIIVSKRVLKSEKKNHLNQSKRMNRGSTKVTPSKCRAGKRNKNDHARARTDCCQRRGSVLVRRPPHLADVEAQACARCLQVCMYFVGVHGKAPPRSSRRSTVHCVCRRLTVMFCAPRTAGTDCDCDSALLNTRVAARRGACAPRRVYCPTHMFARS